MRDAGFVEQHELRVARNAARKAVGQAARGGERQHRDGVGAADAGREHGDGRAQDVHIGVVAGHRAPGGLRLDEGGRRREAAAFLDALPEFSHGAEFRDGQELVGVGGQPERDHAARGVERDAAGFEGAQIGDGGGQRERKLLRLGAAGIVHDAPVGGGERALEAALAQRSAAIAAMRGASSRQGADDRAVQCERAERIEAEADVDRGRRQTLPLDQCPQAPRQARGHAG